MGHGWLEYLALLRVKLPYRAVAMRPSSSKVTLRFLPPPLCTACVLNVWMFSTIICKNELITSGTMIIYIAE